MFKKGDVVLYEGGVVVIGEEVANHYYIVSRVGSGKKIRVWDKSSDEFVEIPEEDKEHAVCEAIQQFMYSMQQQCIESLSAVKDEYRHDADCFLTNLNGEFWH